MSKCVKNADATIEDLEPKLINFKNEQRDLTEAATGDAVQARQCDEGFGAKSTILADIAFRIKVKLSDLITSINECHEPVHTCLGDYLTSLI